jgi:hypothetical protein
VTMLGLSSSGALTCGFSTSSMMLVDWIMRFVPDRVGHEVVAMV